MALTKYTKSESFEVVENVTQKVASLSEAEEAELKAKKEAQGTQVPPDDRV